ncbi:MAG: LysM peptidoglycan-binding domain-containing protein [Bacilli bacterium]|nr:LysM peptidoglycan-binding domain-containing protein [Bacilli bacterium]
MIVIDPSKGGSDNGISSNDILEKDFNLEISKYIYDRLKQLGMDVKMTRDSDETLSNSERINKIINSYGNNSKVIALSNTLSDQGSGVEIIYALRNKDTLARAINDNLKNSNIKVNKYYQKRSKEDTSKDYYDIQSKTGSIETIIVDYGNINNKDEASNLKNNYKTYAEAVIKALANYKGIPYNLDEKDIYIVQKGDSLYSISNKYNITVNELKKINNLTNNNLQIGQKLNIPTSNNQTYIVQKGDNLYSIANKFNTTVDNLKKLNNLTNNLLKVGQILKLDDYINTNYTVQKGDSLYSISNKYNMTVNELKKLNNLTSNNLSIGQQLKIKN